MFDVLVLTTHFLYYLVENCLFFHELYAIALGLLASAK